MMEGWKDEMVEWRNGGMIEEWKNGTME